MKKLKNDLSNLVKPIIEHEAKSAFYKGKLIAVISAKFFLYIKKIIKKASKFSLSYIKELHKK